MRGGVVLSLLMALVLFASGCSKGDDKSSKSVTEEKGKTGDEVKGGGTPTVITCSHIEDEGCIESLKTELMKVEGVASVKGDIPKKTVTVTPKSGVVLSPKALWEAADKSGEKPTKLDGPSGLFTSKPKK